MSLVARIGAAARRLRPPARASWIDALDFDDPAVAADRFPAYERLRALGPVHFLPRPGQWVVVGYEEAKAALGAPAFFSNAPYAPVDPVLLAADPPRQPPLRRLLAPVFEPERMAALGALAEAEARRALAPAFDAVAGFAAPVSRAVAGEMMGLGEDSLAEIVAQAQAARTAADPLAALVGALNALAPRAAVYTRLCESGQGLVGEAEVRSLVALLWLAATSTTERLIVSAILRLMGDPALAERLRGDAAALPAFVEEVARLDPPEHMLPRRTTRATTLGGRELPAGAAVQICVGAANRDPAFFERPAELDLARPFRRHLAFGSGAHHCLGAPLGRRIAAAALGVLLDAAPRLTADLPLDALPWFRTASALTPLALPVRL
ncbi:MAG: cytochrome P450 [Alphaproteobacteria bacterium]|nr:cytochrome P450 [Alphaproteobacteria bacterium]MBV9372534.1 cytochrome P450 [Alphaproteobacteria bacterium]MBV9902237.1 cytochrome P450 [Alphaproteobacteria bacterium]